MLLIILSWIYISFIFFSLGLCMSAMVQRITRSNDQTAPYIVIVLLQGMVATAFIASLLSFVMPLGAWANVLLLAISIACIVIFRKERAAVLARCRIDLRFTTRVLRIIFLFFVVVVAYLALQVSSHYDDGLYYATTIKWIEEYGTVKGLANVNPRIGFNSTWLLLQALFSFHYLDIGNFNDLNGLLLLYVFLYSLGALNSLYSRDYRISTIVRALLVVPLAAFHFGASSDFLLFNINFISSPTADLPVCMLLWLVFVWLLELDKSAPHEHDRPVLNIIIISAFLFILKPSAAPILLTAVLFFIAYVVKGRLLMAGSFVVLATLIVAPWIVRNIFISGYLVFPFPAVDIIQADWKLPIHHARWHENAVRVFAINNEYDLNKPFTMSVPEWFPAWFGKLTFIQSLVFIFSSSAVLTFIVVFIVNLFKNGRRFLSANRYFIFSVLVAVAGSVFWFMKGPDFRLGYGFTAMLVLLLLALMLQYFLDRDIKFAGIALTAFLIYVLGFYYRNTLKEAAKIVWNPLPERRMPEKMEQVKLGNGAVMHIVPNQDSWYAPLPVANNNEYYTIKPESRGATISDGFKPTEKQ